MTSQQGRSPRSLTAEERRIVDESWQAAQASPVRLDPQAGGCLLAFGGMILLTLTPAVGRFFELPPAVARNILVGALILTVAGAALHLFVSPTMPTEDETFRLADKVRAAPTAAARVAAATHLVASAYHHHGPSSVTTFDAGRVASRLGSGLETARAVEAYLVAEGRANPVFPDDLDPNTDAP